MEILFHMYFIIVYNLKNKIAVVLCCGFSYSSRGHPAEIVGAVPIFWLTLAIMGRRVSAAG
jgi:hypothetical protein